MARYRRRRRVSPGVARDARRPALPAAARPIAWSALISSVVLSIAVGPARAAQVNDAVDPPPNSGVRPVPDSPLRLPGAAPTATTPALSTFAQQLEAKQAEMEQAGERAKALNLELQSARTNLALADHNWRAARDRLVTAQERADTDAAKAYKSAIGLPPEVASGLRGFTPLSPVRGDDVASLGSAQELLNAEQAEREAHQAYLASINAQQSKAQEYQAEQARFKQLEAAYLAMRQQHADEIAAAEAERERREQSLGKQFLEQGSLTGYEAAPQALEAVQVALAQLGKPYVWGAEGPNSFDCSGLVWYSYLHGPGRVLPRVAKDQYNGTKDRTVSRYALLPGDLIFFATNPNDWTTVHHVGMYLGNGRMIHAPHTGDVVKISSVWWSEFFAATRVYGEVVAPPAGQTTKPSPSPSHSASPSPSHSASPSPSDSASPSPSPSGGTTTSPPPSSGASTPPGDDNTTPPGEETTPPGDDETTPPGDETTPPGDDTDGEPSGSPSTSPTASTSPSPTASTSPDTSSPDGASPYGS